MEMDKSQRQKLIDIHEARLAILRYQRTTLGENFVAPHIILEIKYIEGELAKLKAHGCTPGPIIPDIQPLRMLVLIATPLVYHSDDGDQLIAPLAVQEELEVIATACKHLDPPIALDILVEIASSNTLQRVFDTNRAPFDILHFTGHGDARAANVALLIEDDHDLGAARPLTAADLHRLLGHSPCRLAFLSICHSERCAQALLDLGVSHVIAINAEETVLDAAARRFAEHFYQALLTGRSVTEAFQRAITAVEYDDTLRVITEPLKFRLLPDGDSVHQQPLVPAFSSGPVRLLHRVWERTNLMPISADPFVGRRHQLYEITHKLNHLGQRCLAIHGPGGIGKTALAEATGRWQHERAYWPEGVWMIELRNVTSAHQARVQIAATLGLEPQTAHNNTALTTALGDWKALLILDDLDKLRVSDNNGLVALLKALIETRWLRLLVTARRTLSQVYHQTITLGRLAEEDALVAFRRYAHPDDRWGDWHQDDLQALMRFLDGYPFPINLAATYMRQTKCGLRELLRRLESDPLHTLRYPGDEDDRTSSLTATLNLSYQALPEDAKFILRVLALFPSGLTSKAARSILDEADAMVIEETLLQHSMAEYREEAGYRRFTLPEPARRYVESLQPSDIMERYAPAALEYFYGFIKDCNRSLIGERISEGRLRLTLEQPNLQRFLDWGYDHEQGGGVCLSARATALLDNYWTITGAKARAGVPQRLQRALAAAQRVGDRLAEAQVLLVIGETYKYNANMHEALRSYELSHKIYDDLRKEMRKVNGSNDTIKHLRREINLGEANVCKAIGDVQLSLHQLNKARWNYKMANDLYLHINARLSAANVIHMIGNSYQLQRNMEEALRCYRQALELYSALEHWLGKANIFHAMGDVYQLLKRMDSALACYVQALDFYRSIEHQLGKANALKAIGDVRFFRKETSAALDSYAQALTLYSSADDRLGEANVLKALGQVHLFSGELGEAGQQYEQALNIYRTMKHSRGEADVLGEQAQLAVLNNDQKTADALLDQAASIYHSLHAKSSYRPPSIPFMIGNCGWALRRAGDYQGASKYLLRAASLFEQQGLDKYAQRHRDAAEGRITTTELDLREKLREFEPQLQGIAELACGRGTRRATSEAWLSQREQEGWHLNAAVQAIWAGERDIATLATSLDSGEEQIVKRILELIG